MMRNASFIFNQKEEDRQSFMAKQFSLHKFFQDRFFNVWKFDSFVSPRVFINPRSWMVLNMYKKKNFRSLDKGSLIYYVRKIFRKTNISYTLIRTHLCAYQGVRNVSFSENFANVINEWSLKNSFMGKVFLETTKRSLIFCCFDEWNGALSFMVFSGKDWTEVLSRWGLV